MLDATRAGVIQQDSTLSGPLPLECGRHGEAWNCWKANPGEQFVALRNISALGFRAYLPAFVARREKGREIIRPLFGPYGFVSFPPGARWQALFSTRGVAKFFTTPGGQPTRVQASIVQALMQRGRPGDGIIDETYQGPVFPDVAGETVKILEGPFANLHGLCRWSTQKRVGVLLEILGGRTVEIQLQRRDVIAETHG